MQYMADPILIQICYARPDRQFLLEQTVPDGTTIQHGIQGFQLAVDTHTPDADIDFRRLLDNAAILDRLLYGLSLIHI